MYFQHQLFKMSSALHKSKSHRKKIHNNLPTAMQTVPDLHRNGLTSCGMHGVSRELTGKIVYKNNIKLNFLSDCNLSQKYTDLNNNQGITCKLKHKNICLLKNMLINCQDEERFCNNENVYRLILNPNQSLSPLKNRFI